MPFTSLLRRDLMPSRRISTLLLIFTLCWYAILYFSLSRSDSLSTILWACLPIAIVPVIAILSGISITRKHMPAILNPSDPNHIPGWQLILSNLIIIAIRMIAYSLFVIILAAWIINRSAAVPSILDLLPIPAMDWFIGVLLLAFCGLLGVSIIGALIVKTGFIFSRFSARSQLPLTVWLTVMIIWTGLRLIPFVSGWLFWLPYAHVTDVTAVGNVFTFFTSYFDSGPYGATIIYLLALVYGSAYAVDTLKKGFSGQYALESGKLRDVPPDSENHNGEKMTTRYGRRPARMPDLRERLLIIMFAVSALFIYDVFDYGLPSAAQVGTIFIRPVYADSIIRGFQVDAPFSTKNGTLHYLPEDAATLHIRGKGDMNVVGTDTQHITVRYAVRIYGESAMQSHALLEHTSMLLDRDGDTIYLRPTFPNSRDEQLIRVNYTIEVPNHLAIHLETSDSIIHFHETVNDAALNVENTSLYASRFQGNITIVGIDADTTFVDGKGDVIVELNDGVIEVHGHAGNITLSGHGTGIHVGSVNGNIDAHLNRSVSLFQNILGDVSVEADQARVETWEVAGQVRIEGIMSPMVLAGAPKDVYVRSDRGNVTIVPSPGTKWATDIETDKGNVINRLEERFTDGIGESGTVNNGNDLKPPLLGDVGSRLDVKTTGADVILR